MKRIFFIVIALLLFSSAALAAGSVTVTGQWKDRNETMYVVKFECTGDSSDGSIPSTAIPDRFMIDVKGLWLVQVIAYPGTTAPDAADVTILDGTFDVLGGKGTNLIHATALQDTYPYSTFMSNWRYWPVKNTLSLATANQGTANANWTVEAVFSK